MKENLMEVIFILDQSGSMSPLQTETINGFNSFIENQKKETGETKITTILFNTSYTILHSGINLKKIPDLTNEDYCPMGCTALLDAIGKTIIDVGVRLNGTPEDQRPSKVLMIITTDGEENASKEFKLEQIKEMIQHQTNTYSWEFSLPYIFP
jgi:uncharacterized protein YegL